MTKSKHGSGHQGSRRGESGVRKEAEGSAPPSRAWRVVVLISGGVVMGVLLGARLGAGSSGSDVKDALLLERVRQIRLLEAVIDRARLKANDLRYEFAQSEDGQRLPQIVAALEEIVSDLTPLPSMGTGEDFMEFTNPSALPGSGNGGV